MITMDERSGSLDGSCLMFCGVDRVENPVRLLSVGTIHGEMASMFKLGF